MIPQIIEVLQLVVHWENYLGTRLENFLFKRNIIRPEQIGFCKNKRTSDHMFVLKTLIEKYTQNNPKVLFSCFIDLRKAFI